MMAKNQNNIVQPLCLSLFVAAVLVSCNKMQESPAPASAPVQQPASQVAQNVPIQPASTSAKKVHPVQAIASSSRKPVVVTSLDFSNRKDPFKPAIVELTQVPKGPGKEVIQNPNLLPIQRYEVDRFKITGIIAGLKENRALLIDPEGKAYVARTGMLIGPNNGKIVRITATSVEIDEAFRDDAGRIKKRTVKLALQRKK